MAADRPPAKHVAAPEAKEPSGEVALAGVAASRAANRRLRIAFVLPIAAFAALACGASWAWIWALAQAAFAFAEPRALAWAATRPPRQAQAVASLYLGLQSAAYSSIAFAPWLSDLENGSLIAGMFLAATALNAVLTLRPSPALLISGAAPAVAILTFAPFAEMAVEQRPFREADVIALLGAAFLTLFTVAAARTLIAADRREAAVRAALEAARLEAEHANESRQRYLRQMSRRLRAPISNMLGAAAILRRTDVPDTVRGAVDSQLDASELLISSLHDLLDIARVESGDARIAPCVCDPRLLAAPVAAVWRPRAERKWLELFVDVDDTTPAQALMDPVRIKQILHALVGNAVENTVNGGVRIRVSGKPLDDGRMEIAFQVSDTGPGIAAGRLAALMDETGANAGREGLGLPISLRLARLMGAAISVRTAPGEGATFTLTIPVDRIAEGEVETVSHAPTVPAASALRVLIADDHAVARRIATAVLSEIGADCVQAGNGQDALTLLSEAPFDLVVLDIQMPDISGIDVARSVRARVGPNRTTPIIAVTAVALGDDRRRCFEAGMDGHVAKPVDPMALLQEVARVTAASGERAVA